MRTTIDLDGALLKRLRATAHREGVSFKALLHRVIARGLAAPAAEPREPYRCPAFAMGEPREPLDKALRLAAALEDDATAHELMLRK